ncbi:response regulator transcription factor [Variovorax arabinosiphilus]|uniref:response regulator transcription factor n=1 Tax=Variovorax arabinosiphilus TaxID=3053498 RepID=UPI0025755F5C|nr:MULTISPECIES: response regulator transcription factor [unclassified Variovorax]MDM0120020.1 response regulator transcription factor [Variovorax sp. J2L1-78]MDM0128067.1 response regulator transcription factor [Variovorax sp. J2L1-63]MDM0231767.1 response regulator transcription factor [Variovorax sp. J2R1-6]
MIEDDDDLREEMVFALGELGFEAQGFPAAPAFYKAFALAPCDIAVVDIGLPGESGLSIVSHLRSIRQIGVVLVTARGQLEERLLGLRHGADAYLVKPVHMAELAETLNAIARRLRTEPAIAVDVHADAPAPAPQEPKRSGPWRLLEGDWVLSDPEGRRMKLTTSERAFVACLFRHRGSAVSRDELIRALGGDVFDFDGHRIDAIASRVRRKAEKLGMRLPLHSVRGTGYVLVK